VKDDFVLVAEYQEFKSAAQSISIADYGTQLGDMWWKGYWEFEIYDLTYLEFAAERGAHAILPQFVAPAPKCDCVSSPKDGGVNAHVETIAEKSALTLR
jgi:hypothetical protein